MTDEEKKTIEQFKNFIFTYQDVIEDEYSDYEEKESAKEYQEVSEKILNLIEKQSKEIEELKEDKYGLEEEVQIQAKQLIEIDGNYISKEESEQKEKQAYIDGTNDAHKLCNKKWEDKIKEICQKKRNQIFSCTYVDEKQWKPFDRAIDAINDLEQSLLEKE